MKKILLLIYLISSGFLFSQSENEEYFNLGIELYNNGNYNEAIIKFKEIIEKGEHSENLYFNLGNAYYKVNDINDLKNKILYLLDNPKKIRDFKDKISFLEWHSYFLAYPNN